MVDKIRSNLSKDLVGIEVKKDKIESTILTSLKNSILEVLIEPPNLVEEIKKSLTPYVILFFGINGSGKTTSIAKLASILQKQGISSVLAAGDTFRAASIEQLQTHGNKLKIPVIASQYGSDPASVAFDAIKYAEKNKIKAVLIDTAGRMYTKANLLREMEKIIRMIQERNLALAVVGKLVIVFLLGTVLASSLILYTYEILVAGAVFLVVYVMLTMVAWYKEETISLALTILCMSGTYLVVLLLGALTPTLPYKWFLLILGIALFIPAWLDLAWGRNQKIRW